MNYRNPSSLTLEMIAEHGIIGLRSCMTRGSRVTRSTQALDFNFLFL